MGARAFFLLAAAALDDGHEVRAFFCEDGVYQCLSNQVPTAGGEFSVSDYVVALIKRGAEITVSSGCMKTRGISPETLCEGVRYGNYDALGRMLEHVDRMVCL